MTAMGTVCSSRKKTAWGQIEREGNRASRGFKFQQQARTSRAGQVGSKTCTAGAQRCAVRLLLLVKHSLAAAAASPLAPPHLLEHAAQRAIIASADRLGGVSVQRTQHARQPTQRQAAHDTRLRPILSSVHARGGRFLQPSTPLHSVDVACKCTGCSRATHMILALME